MKALCFVLFCAIFSFVSCTFPVGTYYVTANGASGAFTISSVAASGKIAGTFFGNPVTGFWSAHENKITFVRVPGTDPSVWQTYVGYYVAGGAYEWAGYFDAFAGSGAIPARSRYAWHANPTAPPTTIPYNPSSLFSGTWTVVANGYSGAASFTFLSSGEISGTFLGNTIRAGFWNIYSGSVVFTVDASGTDPASQQLFKGYLMGTQAGAIYTQYLDGYFVALAGTGATADVTEYQWVGHVQHP